LKLPCRQVIIGAVVVGMVCRRVTEDPGTELRVDPVSGSLVSDGRPWSVPTGNTTSGEHALCLHQAGLACTTAFDFLLLGCLVRRLLRRAMDGTVFGPRVPPRRSTTSPLWQLPQRQQLDKACWTDLICVMVASGALVRSRANHRCRKGRPNTFCTRFGSSCSWSGKSDVIKSDTFKECATFTVDSDSPVYASSSDDEHSCTEIIHEDRNDCYQWEGENPMIALLLPTLERTLMIVPIKRALRIMNLLLEEVGSAVSNVKVCNLDLGPLEPDAAYGCNRQNVTEETWLGNASDSLDTNNFSDSGSDIYDSGSDINDIGCAKLFTRQWTEPIGTHGCSGFVRQRTEELNTRDLAPLFPPRTML